MRWPSAIAVHLAREYTAVTEAARGETSPPPGFKLKRVTDWMAELLADEFGLPRLAEQAGMSEFHFNRLFKRATGAPPSQYLIRPRIDAERRLLRKRTSSVITAANEVGYSNPSHFAQLFRKETGLATTENGRER
ncbi:MAG TPA: AraC family transcriptional regulator [Anaeromyxobacteraceae bacterium]|nr:AraC family transcriptional regulator [Anaeromyxobacteraceae bacterium]